MSQRSVVFVVAVMLIAQVGDIGVCRGQNRVRGRNAPVLIDFDAVEAVPARPGFGGGGAVFRRGNVALQPVVPAHDVPLPADAAKVMEGTDAELSAIQLKTDAEIAELQRKADEAKRLRREKAIAALQELQDKYTRDAKLDEAVAIRDRIRRLKMADMELYQNPGSLSGFQNQIGKSFYFEVVGAIAGPLWGTENYTGDSSLAAAAVHSGVLQPGQKGIVKVTIVEGQDEYEGSEQYGVTSSSFAQYPFGYTVDPWRDTPAKPQ